MLCVAAIALGVVIWTGHRNDVDERTYQTRAMQAAADWTGVLINMNTDNIKESLQRLHDGTVGELNADFDSSIQPYQQVVQKLQSRSRGEVEAVAFEVGAPRPGRPARRPRAVRATAGVDRPSHRHRHGGGHLGQRERRRQAADRALEPAAGGLRRGRQADDLAAGVDPMRNAWRVLAFDVAAPLAAIAALLAIGYVLAWPAWWVSLCSVLVLLIVEGVAVNVCLLRRDSVTVGTDDDAPGLRLAVVALATAALVAAVLTGYRHWTSPDHDLKVDSAEVVRIATEHGRGDGDVLAAEPMAAIDRAAAMMVPEQGNTFKEQFGKATTDLAQRNVTATAATMEAGLEAIGPKAAAVAVVMRATQNEPGQPPDNAVLALRVTLTKQSGHWLVVGVSPLNPR